MTADYQFDPCVNLSTSPYYQTMCGHRIDPGEPYAYSRADRAPLCASCAKKLGHEILRPA